MAYMSQERKAGLVPGIKKVLAKYGMRGSVAVRHHSTLVVNVTGGQLDIIGAYRKIVEAERDRKSDKSWGWLPENHLDVNHHHLEWFEGHEKVHAFLVELRDAAMSGNHYRSDLMTDYFDVGWYLDINVGRWNKPYRLKEAA